MNKEKKSNIIKFLVILLMIFMIIIMYIIYLDKFKDISKINHDIYMKIFWSLFICNWIDIFIIYNLMGDSNIFQRKIIFQKIKYDNQLEKKLMKNLFNNGYKRIENIDYNSFIRTKDQITDVYIVLKDIVYKESIFVNSVDKILNVLVEKDLNITRNNLKIILIFITDNINENKKEKISKYCKQGYKRLMYSIGYDDINNMLYLPVVKDFLYKTEYIKIIKEFKMYIED